LYFTFKVLSKVAKKDFLFCSKFNVESAPISRFLAAKTQRLEVSQKSYNCFSMLCVSLRLRALAAILIFLLFEVGSNFQFPISFFISFFNFFPISLDFPYIFPYFCTSFLFITYVEQIDSLCREQIPLKTNNDGAFSAAVD